MKNVCTQILQADDDVSQTSGKVDANQLVTASFHVIFSDTDAAGTVQIQASNDPCSYGGPTAAAFTPTNWVDIPNASVSITTGGQKLITIAQMTYRWVRVVFTQTSPGTGTITVNMNAMSV